MSINWMKFRRLYLLISLAVIGIGVFSLLKWGLNLGVDFKGGTLIEYRFEKSTSSEELSAEVEKLSVEVTSVQEIDSSTKLFRLASIDDAKKNEITNKLNEKSGGRVEELRFENVGPSIGPELVKKTIVALSISAGTILFWVAYQFKSLKFGVSAILAMLHDMLVVVGLFALFGHFYGAEIDFLIITALLTILSFSVHDTIVVYDRIREIRRKHGGELKDIANSAVNETMRRSINNSLTIIFMLLALVFLGGSTTKWFAVALLIGTISGTYSSPFVAVPLLVTWEELSAHIKLRKK